MYKIMLSLLITLIMSMIIMYLCVNLSKKTIIDREKMSPFECGFDPFSSSRSPFSSQFFLIAVLFLIFDIEIVIILPMILTMKTVKMTTWMITSMIMISVLILGLYHEWNNSMLEWAY